ncbi:hypothetical protein HS088_TW21G00255 [Tripterygium wilfordii]|uniref:DELLA protein RGL1-like n=1 Tax=Tripterygium wilfordii TaxID=458696 RepID=A0A7J7C1V9_TRIWF|nr:GRAS family protein RAD1-like [Tripterygium wilfordii]KAF5728112.1 hypothetical protein HS088_TW21G00255 [Tripterygium wilfordii]
MEAMNWWLSFPLHDSLNQDLAIRRFCPERVEQEHGSDESLMEEAMINDFELFSPSPHTSSNHHLATSEVDELIDSFINIDDDRNDDNKSPDEHQDFNQDDMEMEVFSMLEGDDELLMEMRGSSEEDLAGSTEILPPSVNIEQVSSTHGVDQGLHLVHLLLACAEAVGCRDTQLADSILGQVCASSSPWGDSLQRVAYCFATGLKSRLSLLQNVNPNGLFTNGGMDVSLITREEKMEAFQLVYQTTPYVAFGFMAANEAISQAAQGKDSLHIIDLGMEHALQWPSLIRTLASRPEGPPKIRITGLIMEQNLSELGASMKGLIEDAKSQGVSLEFDMVSEPLTPSLLTREKLNLREGEALFVNGIMHLHKYVKESRGSLKVILQAIKKLGPTLLTVVEQDANHNGPFFLGRFLESLHYYSAIFDSLEASLPRNSPQRLKMERIHFAEEIRNIVAYEGSDRIERHERADQWRRQLGRAGFHVMGLKCMSQARMLLSVYGCDGYTLSLEKGCLLLGWKDRPIMLASAWQVNNINH